MQNTFHSEDYGDLDIEKFVNRLGFAFIMLPNVAHLLGHKGFITTAICYYNEQMEDTPEGKAAIRFVTDFARNNTEEMMKKWYCPELVKEAVRHNCSRGKMPKKGVRRG